MSIHENVRDSLLRGLGTLGSSPVTTLNQGLRLLAKWRCLMLQHTLTKKHGNTVLNGPFKGLILSNESIEGCHLPKIIGCYEQPLSTFIAEAVKRSYKTIVNIGCAEGYYAIGMARLMPDTKVLAFDINPKAAELCKVLAKKNNVSQRVTVQSVFSKENLLDLNPSSTLIICDIEGAEEELLSLEEAPQLENFDVIVESHEVVKNGLTNKLRSRFQATHDIIFVEDDGQRQFKSMPDWFFKLSHLDQLLCTWEWREGPTPWLILKAKSQKRFGD